MWKRVSALSARGAAILLAVVAAAVAVLAILGAPVTQELASGLRSLDDPASASSRAREAVEADTGGSAEPDLLALVPTAGGAGTAPDPRVGGIIKYLRGDPDVATVVGPGTPGGEHLVGTDGRSQVVAVTLRAGDEDQRNTARTRLQEWLATHPGVQVSGLGALEGAMTSQLEDDLLTAELIAFPLLFLASLWIFRSAVAALLPLLVGGAALVSTLAVLRAANSVVGLSTFVTNLVIMLTLGLAIDYSLFFVNRYREELARTGDHGSALHTTLRTTGRTMAFSALLVAAALGSLLVFPVQFVYSMGIAGLIAPLIAVASALVILPLLLTLLGSKVNALAPRWLQRSAARESRPAEAGPWYRIARFVMRQPVKIIIGATAVLLALGAPVAGLQISGFTAEQLPTTTPMRAAHDAIGQALPRQTAARAYVVLDAPGVNPGQLADYTTRIDALPDVAEVSPPQQLSSQRWRIDVTARAGDLTGPARQAVADIRALPAPGVAYLGGLTPAFVDELSALRAGLPWCLLVLIGAMLILLFLFTRSLILPLKTLVMNLVTLIATVGVLVMVFQWLRFGQPPGALSALEVSTLIVTVTTAFGLATDYGVFVLGRIAEGHAAGQPDESAIATGMERTGRLVTAAALLFGITVGAFASSQLVFVKQLAIGLLVAVVLDATLVRAFLVPALMRVLGPVNWWAPRWLGGRHAPAPPAPVTPRPSPTPRRQPPATAGDGADSHSTGRTS